MGRGILDGFSIEVATETLAPGMIWGRRFGSMDLPIEGFGIDDFGLADGLVKDGVGDGLMVVKDGDFSLGILTDGDLSITEGIIWAARLDLVDNIVGLDSQVFGKGALFLVGQDEIQVFGLEQRAVGIMRTAWLDCEAPVEIISELG